METVFSSAYFDQSISEFADARGAKKSSTTSRQVGKALSDLMGRWAPTSDIFHLG
jgi:hypothetical protein